MYNTLKSYPEGDWYHSCASKLDVSFGLWWADRSESCEVTHNQSSIERNNLADTRCIGDIQCFEVSTSFTQLTVLECSATFHSCHCDSP
jgi:hypothetical protein